MKITIKMLLLVVMLFSCSQFIRAEDPLSYVYADGWWDEIPAYGGGTAVNEDNSSITYSEGGYFSYNSQITTYDNPFIFAQCQWNQNSKLLDLSINQLMYESGEWGSTTGTLNQWWNVDDGGSFEPQMFLNVSGPCQNNQVAQPVIPESPETITYGPHVGVSYMTYVWAGGVTGGILYRHRAHESSAAKAKCCDLTANGIIFSEFAGDAAKMMTPWGDYIPDCIGGLYYPHSNPGIWCYDLSTN